MEQFKPERLHRVQEGYARVFARPSALDGPGLELEVGEQVVRERHELLPGPVPGVALGGDAVKGQPGLQLRDRLLMVAAPAREVPQIPHGQGEIACYRRILVMPVVGVAQIQLIVLRRPMRALRPVDGARHYSESVSSGTTLTVGGSSSNVADTSFHRVGFGSSSLINLQLALMRHSSE